jgi:hypothetical protein
MKEEQMKTSYEIYLILDSDGDYECGPDENAAVEAYESNIAPGAELAGLSAST